MQSKLKMDSGAVFADEVMISFSVKTDKEGKKKDPVVRIGFIDAMKKAVVSEVVITPTTARALSQIIENTLKKLEEHMEGKTTKKEDTTSYIG